ncbi:MAG: glycoside hydrolase family 140 protein [Chitinophagaceae bacterium]
MKKIVFIITLLIGYNVFAQPELPLLQVSANKRFFQTSDGKPFFWLGDTGWLLFTKCDDEQTIHYLDMRKQQGFNMVQAMVLHTLAAVNTTGDSALINKDISKPNINGGAKGYWNHIEFVITEAAKRGIYIGLVPIWGGNVKSGKITVQQAEAYAKFLAERFGKYNNIVWLNGGDIPGSEKMEVWKAIGATIKKYDPRHLETFHPRGRYSSSTWFHKEPWLDFDMFQSGHQDYSQDTSSKEINHYGEDNWKYVNVDYKLLPVKPTIDGEPSYENIPHGLHDSLQPRWQPADIRRYAYWSVFAGGAGFTYGENAIMQFHSDLKKRGSFGVNQVWTATIDAPAAKQMQYLKNLMLSENYFDRTPAQSIVANNAGAKYNYVLATKGKNYAMVYTYTGKELNIDISKLGFAPIKAYWYDPKNGQKTAIADVKKSGIVQFDPPGKEGEGNDWVLVLKKM